MTEALTDALAARHGIVCAVGAGGKKTTLYRLTAAHPGRVALTASAHTTFFPSTLDLDQYVEAPEILLESVPRSVRSKVGYATPSTRSGRHAGVPLSLIAQIHERGRFDVTLVKADGARMRLLKSPGDHEPVLPPGMTTMLPVVSVAAIGQQLTEEIVHRIEQTAVIARLRPDDLIEPIHVARLIASPDGLLKGAGDAVVVPVINMADNPEQERTAREIAGLALDLSHRFDRVVIASMRRRRDPLVAIVER